MITTLKRAIKKGLRLAGFEIRRASPPRLCTAQITHSGVERERGTLASAVAVAAGNGLRPATVIDCGAAFGTTELYAQFPYARHVLVEPLAEYRKALESVARSLGSVDIVEAVAAAHEGTATINVHPDLVGSSMYLEVEESDVNGVPREVPTVTLDGVCRRLGTCGPYVVKVDVQGAELDVLRGAVGILPETELIVLETSLFKFFKGAPQMPEVVAFMAERRFVPYDIVSAQYRLLDGAMSQVDIVFVREDGALRFHHTYANPEQRRRQTEAFLGNNREQALERQAQ